MTTKEIKHVTGIMPNGAVKKALLHILEFQMQAGFSENESMESLTQRRAAMFDCIMKAANLLRNHYKKKYGIDLLKVSHYGKTYASKIKTGLGLLIGGTQLTETPLSKEDLQVFIHSSLSISSTLATCIVAVDMEKVDLEEEEEEREEENVEETISRLSAEIEQQPNNVELYTERGIAYFQLANFSAAEADFSQAIALHPEEADYWACRAYVYKAMEKWDDALASYNQALLLYPEDTEPSNITNSLRERGEVYLQLNEFEKALSDFQKLDSSDDDDLKKLIRKAAKGVQETKTFDERLFPYRIKINLLKEDPELPIFETVIITQDYRELLATMIIYEEYDLIERFFREYGRRYLNEYLNVAFSWYEPTPLYFMTVQKAREKMEDPYKMLCYLVANGADVNLPAGDGDTPLFNQIYPVGSLEIMETLLELDADPDQLSIKDGIEYYPLQFSLLPYDIDEDDNVLPYGSLSIEKAKLLLKYGADPNLSSGEWSNYSPLVMAIIYGPDTAENRELIKLLLEKGADPNFTDSEGKTPLQYAVEKNMTEVCRLLSLK